MAGLTPDPIAMAQVNVLTEQNDIGRTGQNLNETILTTANVNPTQFGLLFSQPVAGALHGQPLYISGITINGATHNVVYVAAVNGFVYAFDANSNAGADASPLWSISLLDAAHGAPSGATAIGSLGTLATPVIDLAGNTMYLTSGDYESGTPVYRLHALDLTTGEEKLGGPVAIAPSVSGTAADAVDGVVTMTPRDHQARPGLLLLNGIVYVAFGSRNEGYLETWHGWIIGYNSSTLAQTGVFCISPNGNGGGIWLSSGGLAADQTDPVNHPYGRIFVGTGNGDFNATLPYTKDMDFGDSILNLDLTDGDPVVTDSFTPSNQSLLNSKDGDQGSGGLLVLPTQTAGAYPHLLVQAGKSGTLYLLNRENLGGYQSTVQVVESSPNAVGNTGAYDAPAYWNGNVYYWGEYDYLKSFSLSGGLLSTTPTESVEMSAFPGSTPLISANGNTQGIVWTIDADAASTGGPAILQAHDASNVATTLYSSATNAARDTAGTAITFVEPTVANGMVYVETGNQLDVYGLLGSGQTSTPLISPGSESFSTSAQVTITDATSGSSIYYTTDGTPATINSIPYTGSISVSSNETINAIAVAPGLTSSYQAWAIYTQQATATPTFSTPAVAYAGTQSVTIRDSTANAVIHYTTDGSVPTLGSEVYSGPITVAATETITAIAAAPGYLTSGVASATYEIVSAGTILVSNSTGFASAAGLNLLGNATVTNNVLQLTVGSTGTASAAWHTTPVNIQSFTTDFYFTIQETQDTADGFTFTMQNSPAGLNAIGGVNGGLGYQGIGSSVAVKFDIFDNAGEGYDSVGFYTNGAAPTIPALDMTGKLSLVGHALHATISYDGTTLTLTLADTVTGASVMTSAAMNIPAIVGANTAYVGFTAGPGATQTITDWTYVSNAGSGSQVATPTFSPEQGAYSGSQSITISDASNGVVLYYTTDGSTPTTSSAVYSSPITVAVNQTLKAVAVSSGNATSEVGAATYQIAASVPTFAPVAGIYASAQSIAIADATAGAVVHYTIDGSVPTASSTVYSGPISVTANETLKAVAIISGNSNSEVGIAVYQISTPAPTFTPVAGIYPSAQMVTIADAASSAVIYYTVNGSRPTASSPVYAGPISVTADETVKAVAIAPGYASSAVTSGTYQIKTAAPSFTPAGGTYPGTQSVTMSDATTGAVIYFTTDGSQPTTSSTAYSGPVSVASDETLKAIAVAGGYATSLTTTAAYKIQVGAPSFSPAAGTYSNTQTITITDAVAGAVIHFTTNGTQPSTSSAVYSGPITVSGNETLKAIAVAGSYATSPAATAIYKFQAATPSFAPVGGTYSGAQSVTIADASAGAVIHYTTDGTNPTTSSMVYSGPVTVSANGRLKALAAETGYANSPIGNATYKIQ